MDKNILLKVDARKKLLDGANKLANTVKITMGAKGKLVLIEDLQNGTPFLTKDGITVANEVDLVDRYENLGVKMLRQAAQRSLDEVKDGTTTATVLGQALINEGFDKNVKEVVKNYEKDLKTTLNALKKLSKKVTYKQLRQVATLSANGDKEIGNLVAKAMQEVGKDGHIKVESTISDNTSVEITEGITVETGLSSQYFATDAKTMSCVLENPSFILYTEKINSLESFFNYIQEATSQNIPLVFMSPDIDMPILQAMAKSNVTSGTKLVWIRTPENGDKQTKILADIAWVTKSPIFTPLNVNEGLIQLGSASSIVIRPTSTSIILNNDSHLELIKALKEELKNSEDEFFINKRINNLSSKIATIKVGGLTETEQRERHDRVDDAVGAVKSALKGGVVAGAGNTLAFLSKELDLSEPFSKALQAPMKVILDNAGISPKEECYIYNKGFNVQTDEFQEDLKSEGIIDSTQSISKALESAVSVANNFLNTSGVILTIN